MKSTFFASLLAGIASAGKISYNSADLSEFNIPRVYPKANLNSLYASTGNTKATNKNIFGIIHEAE